MFQLGLWGCAPQVRPAPAPSAQDPGEMPPPTPPPADASLNADESLVRAAMARHVEKLSSTIGERHASKAWELADAADYIAAELEALGYTIERQGYEVGSALAQNLSVTIPGGTRGDERILIGAHYDSPVGSRGLTSAVSTAGLLELARVMHGAKLERTLSLVFFALGAGPDSSGQARGARHFAQALGLAKQRAATLPTAAPHDATVGFAAALLLENLLIAEPRPDLPVRMPVVSSPGAVKFEAVLAASVNDELMVLAPAPWEGAESDALALHEQGIPSVAVGVNPMGAKEAGAVSHLALDQAARALLRLRYALGDWVMERPTNDEMVTPVSP